MRRNRVTSALINGILKLDAADLPLLHLIPPDTKRRFVRQFFGSLRHVHQDGPVKINGVWFETPGTVQNRLSLAAAQEPIRRVIGRCLRPGMTVVDVGANVGYHTIMAAKQVCPSGRVYAIEPLPENVRVLQGNVALNGFTNVIVMPYAAGRSSETRMLYIRDSGTNSLFPRRADVDIAGTMEIPVVSIDDAVPCDIDFAKIDVEGAELDVLDGMQRTIRNRPDLQLVVEWNPVCQESAGRSPDELPLWLIDAGFTLWPVDDRFGGPITQADLPAILQELAHRRVYWTDLYAVRSKRCWAA